MRFHSMILKSLALALAVSFSTSNSAFADVRARVSAQDVGIGETFQLQLESDGADLSYAPDLSPLHASFDILGTGQSSQMRIVNGMRSDTYSWTITLSPKAKGAQTIPALRFGDDQTRPMMINVVERSQRAAATATASGIEIEVSAEPGTHHVQEEIPLTVRIFAGADLREAALETPTDSAFVLTQRGEDRSGQITRNGRLVSMIERDYMLKPQESGTLTIPPLILRAVVQGKNPRRSPFSGSPFDDMFGRAPFGRSIFSDMMSPGRQVVVRSEPLVLDIMARPTSNGGWFLPAKNVKLMAEWSQENSEFRVGETATRKVRLLALGASKEQLPTIDVRDADGAKVYIDRSADRSIDTPEGTAAVREIVTSVVPTRAGEITLPALEIKWWDTEADRERTATLPAETFTVAGGAGALTLGNEAAIVAPASAKNVDDIAANNVTELNWALIAIATAGWLLIVLVIVGLSWRRRKGLSHRRSLTPREDGSRHSIVESIHQKKIGLAERDLRAACRSNNQSAAYAALTAWLHHVRASVGSPVLPELEKAPMISKELRKMERSLYAGTPAASWTGARMFAAFLKEKAKLSSTVKANTSDKVLPPLYPNSSRFGSSRAET